MIRYPYAAVFSDPFKIDFEHISVFILEGGNELIKAGPFFHEADSFFELTL
jgi:hypothetical protein